MQKTYERINWENEPSTNTPINEDNLNKIDYALDVVDTRVVGLYGYEERAKQSEENASASEYNAKIYMDGAKEHSEEAEEYSTKAKEYMEDAFATTPDGYADVVEKVKYMDIKTSNENALLRSKEGGLRVVEIVGNSEQKTLTGKNLIPYPYHETTHTETGITWTDNGDGTITVNGTATATAYYNLRVRTESKGFVLPKGKYILSGTPSTGSASTYYIQIGRVVDGAYVHLTNDLGKGAEFTLTEDTRLQLQAVVRVSATVSNITFKPMLRRAEITDDTWEPYVGGVPSPNPDYPQEIESVGGKNLLPYPHLETTNTENGITWTDNGDGTVTANGTNTSSSQILFDCCARQDITQPVILPKGKYTFNGCPSGGSTNTYYVQVGITENDAWKVLGFDTGNGTTIELLEEKQLQIQLGIKAGVTVNNLTFKPMLRKADIVDDTYVPYGHIGVKTTGKNLIPYPHTHTTRTEDDVTMTDNGDGTMTANGTATGQMDYYFIGTTNMLPLKKGTYVLSGCPTGGNLDKTYFMLLGYRNNGVLTRLTYDAGDGSIFTLEEDAKIYILARIMTGVVATNLTFKPMLRRCDENGNPMGDDIFESYREHIEYINLAEPLRKVGSVVDRIVKRNGVWGVERNVARVRVTSEQEGTWNVDTVGDDRRFAIKTNGNDWISRGNGKYERSTHFIENNSGNIGLHGRFYLSTRYAVFTDNDSYWADLDAFKTWLDANEVYIEYGLATPTFEPLDTESQIALNNLKTFDGVTYIDFDSTIQPSAFEFKYGSSDVGAGVLNNDERLRNLEIGLSDIPVPLLLTEWVEDNGTFTQTVAVNGVKGTESPTIQISPVGDLATEDELNSFACISGVETIENGIVFTATEKPSISFTVIAKCVLASGGSAVVDVTAIVGRVSELETEVDGLNRNMQGEDITCTVLGTPTTTDYPNGYECKKFGNLVTLSGDITVSASALLTVPESIRPLHTKFSVGVLKVGTNDKCFARINKNGNISIQANNGSEVNARVIFDISYTLG